MVSLKTVRSPAALAGQLAQSTRLNGPADFLASLDPETTLRVSHPIVALATLPSALYGPFVFVWCLGCCVT